MRTKTVTFAWNVCRKCHRHSFAQFFFLFWRLFIVLFGENESMFKWKTTLTSMWNVECGTCTYMVLNNDRTTLFNSFHLKSWLQKRYWQLVRSNEYEKKEIKRINYLQNDIPPLWFLYSFLFFFSLYTFIHWWNKVSMADTLVRFYQANLTGWRNNIDIIQIDTRNLFI